MAALYQTEFVHPVRAITVMQPHAELIASGAKRIENRDRPTKYRGPLVIHAGKGKSRLLDLPEYDLGDRDALPVGAIVAVVNVVDCCWIDGPLTGAQRRLVREQGGMATGPCCWVLANARRPHLGPVPVTGAQAIWFLPPETIDCLNKAW